MSQSKRIQLDLPKDWRTFRMPRGLQSRLQELFHVRPEGGPPVADQPRPSAWDTFTINHDSPNGAALIGDRHCRFNVS